MAIDPTGVLPTEKQKYDWEMSGSGAGLTAGTIYDQLRQRIEEIRQQKEEHRAKALSTIAAIQTMDQFNTYYAQMGENLAAIRRQGAEMGEEVNQIQQTLDERMQALGIALQQKREELTTVTDPDQRAKLEQAIQNGESQLKLYAQERTQLGQEFGQYSQKLASAQEKYDAIQAKIDAHSGDNVPEHLKNALRDAENEISGAQTALAQVQARADFAQNAIEKTTEAFTATTQGDAYKNYSLDQLKAQGELSAAFITARTDGTLDQTEQAQLGALYQQSGLSPDDPNAAAQIAAIGNTYNVIDTSGNTLTGQAATDYLNAQFAALQTGVAEETAQQHAVQAAVDNPLTQLTTRAAALQASADAQTNPDDIGVAMPGVIAASTLADSYTEKAQTLNEQYAAYDQEVQAAQQALNALDPATATQAQITAAQDTLTAAQTARQDVLTEAQETLDALDQSQALSTELATSCASVEHGRELFAQTLEIDQQLNGTAAKTAQAGDNIATLDPTNLTLPNSVEVIGSAAAAGQITTLELTPDPAYDNATQQIAQLIESNNFVTRDQINMVLGPNADPALVQKVDDWLAKRSTNVMESTVDNPTPTNSRFVNEPTPNTVFGQPMPANAIHVPGLVRGDAAPAQYKSFADSLDFAATNPTGGATPTYVMDRPAHIPESGTATNSFGAMLKPQQQGTATGSTEAMNPTEYQAYLQRQATLSAAEQGLGPQGGGNPGTT